MVAQQAETIEDLQASPVREVDRLVALDFIRGIAVLGILVANIALMGFPMLAGIWPPALGVSPGNPMDRLDEALWLAQHVLIDGKMRGLFTVLFGAGMMLFVERAWDRGESGLLQLRRLAWLALFGALHFYFLWWGDILFLYAVAGLAAFLMTGWQAGTQLRVGFMWYFVAALLYVAALFPAMQFDISEQARLAQPEAYAATQANWDGRIAEAGEEQAAYLSGSYVEEVRFVWQERTSRLVNTPSSAIYEAIPLMLIGMGLFRCGFFSGGLDPGRQRRWGWIGVLGGAAVSLATGLSLIIDGFPQSLTSFVISGVEKIPRLAMIVGLAALLALLAPRATDSRLGSRIVAAGRMAFSNYILCSALGMLVFRSWAGGLWGKLDRAELVLVVALFWVLMLAWSKPWLARYRFGPFEWLWRCLTYWKWFPLRR